MQEDNIELRQKPKNMYAAICITQAVCIAVILIGLLIIKTFFGSCYENLSQWYQENFLYEANAQQVFEEV